MNFQVKVLSIILALCFVLSACSSAGTASDSKEKEAAQTTTPTTTQTTQETTVPKEPEDYLATGFEARDIVKAYFEKHGFSFDDWEVVSDTADSYQLIKPGGGAGIVAQKNSLVFNMEQTSGSNAVTVYKETNDINVSIMITSDTSCDAYEILELLFPDCPDEIMPPIAEIKSKTQGSGGQFIDIEQDGLYYRSSENRIPNSSETFTMISVYKQAPGSWNG